MAFDKTRTFTADVIDRDGNKGTFAGEVTYNPCGGETEARVGIQAHLASEGLTATNIDFGEDK